MALVFPIAEERQKLKVVGFPKKDTLGKDYDIGDVDYYESEENQILEWWPKRDNPFIELRRRVRTI